MQLKVLAVLFTVTFFHNLSAQRCHLPIISQPTIVVIQADTASGLSCAQKRRCFDELVLPPIKAELPRGLGYFPSAVPLVESYYSPAVEVGCNCCGASVPVTSPCSCLTLAAPLCPDLAPLVRPVIL